MVSRIGCLVAVLGLLWLRTIVLGKLFPIEPRHSIVESYEVSEDKPGSIWPLANHETTYWTRKHLKPGNFVITSDYPECDIVSEASRRYVKYLFLDGPDHAPVAVPQATYPERLEGLKILVERKECGYPKLDDDESYSLNVLPGYNGAKLNCKTVWGALRGLETFSQLVYYDADDKMFYLNDTSITDRPAYTHRGMLLDTSRHYMPLRLLKTNLDAMAFNKFNVFHWHIVDDQSFPFQSHTYPNLSLLGAYTQRHIYTHDNVKDLIEYARLRGIRVIPEFDSPSHTHSIGNAFPNLITPCYVDGKPHKSYGSDYSEDEVLNPILDETYNFMKDIITEFKGLFKDDFIHLGMDETNLECWKSNPDLNAFMAKSNMRGATELLEYYSQRVIDITRSIGYKYIIWEDPLEWGVNVHDETVIEVWKGGWEFRALDIARNGHRIILSSCWYLNLISYGSDWYQYYNCDPRSFTNDPTLQEMVIGGEACLWAEFIDQNNLLSTLWPRASAVAERLWYNASRLTPADVVNRLDRHRCRMLRRGISTKPLLNGFCGEFEIEKDEISATPKGEELVQTTSFPVELNLNLHYVISFAGILIVIFLIVKFIPRTLRAKILFILPKWRCKSRSSI